MSMLFITLGVNQEAPFAIYAAHNTGRKDRSKKMKGATRYDIYRFNATTGKREEKIGTVSHYPAQRAETLARTALTLVSL